MRIGYMALLLLAAGAAAEEVTAYITTDGPASPYAAKKMASSIFRKAGVAIKWQEPRAVAAGAQPACLHIRLAERTPDERLPGALGVSYPFQGCSRSITVFLDRIRSIAGRSDRETALLAYVLVHEIAHVIQGVHRHSDAGIMKARWNASDREAIFDGRLGFLEKDVFLMRRALAAGRNRLGGPAPESLALNGRSESGIAFRPE